MGGVQVGRGEEVNGEMRVQSMGEIGKDFYPISSSLFLKTLTEGAVTTEAGSLFQYITTPPPENTDPLLRRWLAPWGTL